MKRLLRFSGNLNTLPVFMPLKKQLEVEALQENRRIGIPTATIVQFSITSHLHSRFFTSMGGDFPEECKQATLETVLSESTLMKMNWRGVNGRLSLADTTWKHNY